MSGKLSTDARELVLYTENTSSMREERVRQFRSRTRG